MTYRELIASSDRILPDKDAWQQYGAIAEWLERFLPTASESRSPRSSVESKSQILHELEFSTGTAEKQENFLQSFVKTDLVERAMSPNMPLVLGRKGTGKTAIFRRILEGEEFKCTVVMSPSDFRRNRPWVLNPDGFDSIDRALETSGRGWREFWSVYTPLAVWLSSDARERGSPPRHPLNDAVESLTNGGAPDELKVVTRLKQMLAIPHKPAWICRHAWQRLPTRRD